MTKHVVMFSGGIASWAAAKLVVQKHGVKDTVLFFTDTLIEDEDLYRFLDEAAANVGAPLVKIAEGRTPWQVFNDKRFLGNSRIDPCSQILKRDLSDKWLIDNYDPNDTIVYVGIHHEEEHRFTRLRERKLQKGWVYEAPLCEPPLIPYQEMHNWLEREGIRRPRLYDMGFSHNNCGGFCIKAGKGHYANLLEKLPERYKEHEQKEQDFQKFIGREVTILREQVKGEKYTLSLRTLRERLEQGGTVNKYDHGGCGCFLDDPNEDAVSSQQLEDAE